MKVLNKICENGQIIGYVVDDDGLITELLSKCLYVEMYIEQMVAAGYKYHDYNADNIEDAAGNKISDLPEVGADVMDEDTRFYLGEMAESALSDVECVKYYVYKNDSVIEWKAPVTEEIKTREALIAYLEEVENSYQHSGFCTDNVPLNSFVAKEALFSIDEINKDPKIQKLFSVCQRRHVFKNWAAYERTLKFLKDNGALTTNNPTYIEFLAAYYAWGIDGIKDDCLKVVTRQAVDGPFNKYTDVAESGNYLSNRRDEFILWDSNYRAHYLGTTVDMSNIGQFDREPIAMGADRLFELKRDNSKWESRFRVIPGMVANVSDRSYYEFLSDGGYPYQVRVTHNALTVFSGAYIVVQLNNFAIRSVIPSINLTLEEVSSAEEYYLWNLAITKGQSISKMRSKEVPVASTYQMLREEGINPKAAIKMMARDIKFVDYTSNSSYVNQAGTRADYLKAFDNYMRPIPESILEHYGVDEYEDTDDFLNQAIDPDATIDDGVGKKKLSKQEKVLSALVGGASDSDPKDYFDSLEFVRACLNNEVTINRFGEGKFEDYGATAYQAAKIIITAMLALKDTLTSSIDKEDFIARFESMDAINIERVFRYRDAAYNGYICDLSACREARALKSWSWCYCTRVFRELSNKEIKDQRPYLMEMITVTDKSIRGALADCVKSAIDNSFPDLVRNAIDMQAHYFAARLFFAILSRQINNNHLKDGVYEVALTVFEENKITVRIPASLYMSVARYDIKSNMYYMTVYDYCQFEYDDAGAFSLFMVNADIDPWHVIPKKGYVIPTYNFMVNYNSDEVLEKALGAQYVQAIASLKSRAVPAIGRIDPSQFLPGGFDSLYADETEYTADTIDLFLSDKVPESVKNYKDRWVEKRKAARVDGLKILQIPLKQDIVFKNIAKYCGVEDIDDSVQYSSNLQDDNKCLYTAQKGELTRETAMPIVAITVAMVTKKVFDISEYKFEDIYTWSSILRGTFEPPFTCYMHNGALAFIGADNGEDTFIMLSQLTKSQLDALAESGMVYWIGESRYFVRAYNGDFVLEV